MEASKLVLCGRPCQGMPPSRHATCSRVSGRVLREERKRVKYHVRVGAGPDYSQKSYMSRKITVLMDERGERNPYSLQPWHPQGYRRDRTRTKPSKRDVATLNRGRLRLTEPEVSAPHIRIFEEARTKTELQEGISSIVKGQESCCKS